MMKICHITSVHSKNDTRVFIKECQSLSKAGHEVFYIVPNVEDNIENGVKIIGVDSSVTGQINRIRKTTKKVFTKAIEMDADVYHFHDPELMPIGLKLKAKGKKVIYDVHEDVPEQVLSKQWIPKPLRKSISVLVKRYEKYASKKFDAVVAATPTIANRFKSYNPNTITVHNYPLLDELVAPERNMDSSNPSALYIGGIYLLRGIKEMILAVEGLNRNKDCNLTLAGAFAPAHLEQEIREMDGWKFVDYRGFLNRDEVREVLSQAHMGLVLLHPEPRFVVSLPIKLFEYMSAGIPVIASNFPLWKEIVEENQCGLCVDPLNIDEIKEAMRWILDHPAEAKAMGENGRKAIEEKYNWESESEKLISLYRTFETNTQRVLAN